MSMMDNVLSALCLHRGGNFGQRQRGYLSGEEKPVRMRQINSTENYRVRERDCFDNVRI